MTSFSLDNNPAQYQIRGFKPGQIQVNDKILTCSLIISAHQLLENWAPLSALQITRETLAPAAALKPAILLIGTGKAQHFLPLETYGDLLNQGIGVEVMDTAAACRTYNALTSENREVVAALILS